MECRKFSINLISASGLENVSDRMKVYAAVTIGGKKETKKKTPVDNHNGTNPAWNYTLEYAVADEAVLQEGVMLAIKLKCSHTLKRNRYIGEVHVSLKELFDKAAESGGSASFNYQVKRGGSKEVGRGELKFSCSFGEKEIIEPSDSNSRWKGVLTVGAMVLLEVAASAALGGVVHQIPLWY